MGKGKAGVLKAEGQLLKHSTSKVGRPALWTQAQRKAIDESIPAWLHFALVLNKGLDGVHKDLQKWKKDEANRLLSLSEFKVLPPDLDIKQARTTIIRKFTNERNRVKEKDDSQSAQLQKALETAAIAMVDYRTFSKGKSLFKRQRNAEIVARRTQIMNLEKSLPLVAAHQRALKNLWSEEDQDYWEKEASNEPDDLYTRQKDFTEHMHNCLYALCRSGGLGKMELLLLYGFRDQFDNVETGLIETHHADGVPNFSRSCKEVEGVENAFGLWLSKAIPETLVRGASDYQISRSWNGLPLFPDIPLTEESADVIRSVIKGFFGYVWEHCRPHQGKIPWDRIRSNPAEFYDSLKYQFDLRDPSTLTPSEVLAIAEVLSSSDPFIFLPSLDQIQSQPPSHESASSKYPDPNIILHGETGKAQSQSRMESHFPVSNPALKKMLAHKRHRTVPSNEADYLDVDTLEEGEPDTNQPSRVPSSPISLVSDNGQTNSSEFTASATVATSSTVATMTTTDLMVNGQSVNSTSATALSSPPLSSTSIHSTKKSRQRSSTLSESDSVDNVEDSFDTAISSASHTGEKSAAASTHLSSEMLQSDYRSLAETSKLDVHRNPPLSVSASRSHTPKDEVALHASTPKQHDRDSSPPPATNQTSPLPTMDQTPTPPIPPLQTVDYSPPDPTLLSSATPGNDDGAAMNTPLPNILPNMNPPASLPHPLPTSSDKDSLGSSVKGNAVIDGTSKCEETHPKSPAGSNEVAGAVRSKAVTKRKRNQKTEMVQHELGPATSGRKTRSRVNPRASIQNVPDSQAKNSVSKKYEGEEVVMDDGRIGILRYEKFYVGARFFPSNGDEDEWMTDAEDRVVQVNKRPSQKRRRKA